MTAIQKSIRTFGEEMERRSELFSKMLPRGLAVDRFKKVVLAAYSRNRQLQQCTMASVLTAVIQASELGLEPTGSLGGAYLVPYKDQCTLIIGYRGFIDLARRSAKVKKVEAHVVYSNDNFSYSYGTDPKLVHKPAMGERGDIIGVYAWALMEKGVKQFEFLSKPEVDKIKAISKAKKGPWVEFEDEMTRKTAVRRLAKYLPLSPETRDAIERADELEFGDLRDVTPDEVVSAPAKTGVERVKARLRDQEAEDAVEAPLTPEGSATEQPAPLPTASDLNPVDDRAADEAWQRGEDVQPVAPTPKEKR
jgi:recombination protein RecT